MTENSTNQQELLALAKTEEGRARAADSYGLMLAYHRRVTATLSDKAACAAHEARNRLQTCKQGYWEIERQLEELEGKGELATFLGCSPRHRAGYHAETLGDWRKVMSAESLADLFKLLRVRLDEWKAVAEVQLQELNDLQDKSDRLCEEAVDAYGEYIRYVALGEKPRDAEGNVKELVGKWRAEPVFGKEAGDA